MCDIFNLNKSETESKHNLISNKLKELRIIQQERCKNKMKLIGNVKITLMDSLCKDISEGNLSMSSDMVLLERMGGGKINIPAYVIIAYSYTEKKMNMQMRPDFFIEQCFLEFHSQEQLKQTIKLLSFKPIPVEVYYEQNINSDTNSNESGQTKTENLDGSFDSEIPLEGD